MENGKNGTHNHVWAGPSTLSPFGPNAVFVSASDHKRRICEEVGIHVESDITKVTHVGNGEKKHDAMNSHGVVIRRRAVDVPYPILVAEAKAKELLHRFKPNGHDHVVADSTWEILSGDGHVLSLNKPEGNDGKEEQIARVLYAHQGHNISSDTGLAVISHDLNHIHLYHATFMVGAINPQLQVGQVERMITHNPNISGGFSILEAISYGVIVPTPLLHLRVRKIKPSGAPYISGKVMDYDALIHETSSDSSNNEWMQRLAIGIIPRR